MFTFGKRTSSLLFLALEHRRGLSDLLRDIWLTSENYSQMKVLTTLQDIPNSPRW